jgi:D-alanyl-D-alanine carboxypeptidase/D-alanyl-D-alanine-endopeptidase (penicillin-binding protein 4)
MKKIRSMNIIRHLLKWRPLSCRVKKQVDGGCNYQIRNSSPVATKITCLQAAMKYQSGGLGHRREANGEWQVASGKNLLILLVSSFLPLACSVNKEISQSAKENVLSKPAFLSAHTGISIYEPATGKTWYDYQGDKYFVPASNTKLPTCYAAMKYLGDSLIGLMYDTRNELGKIYIKGTGDPTFLHPDFKSQRVFDFLVSQNLPIVITNPNFIEQPLGSGWSWNDYNEYYMAERSGLPIYGNTGRWKWLSASSDTLAFSVIPRIFRDSLRLFPIEYDPFQAPAPRVKVYLQIVRDKASNQYHLLQAHNQVRNFEIPFETTSTGTLARMLSDTSKLEVTANPSNWMYQRYIIKSNPTDSMLKLMMHRSDNFFAEQALLMVSNQLLGVMNDEKIIDTLLKTDFRDLPQKPRWADGSGLSRYNLFSPKDLVMILDKMRKDFGMERMKVILATGGEGTISNYYKADSSYIYGKTGTLSGVVAFSGYLYTKKGKLLIFSTLINNHQASATDVRRAIEKFLQGIRQRY